MSTIPQTAKDIFLAALEVEPAERATLLHKACAGDAALRAHVEALLQVHDEPDSVFDQPRIELELSDSGLAGDPAVTEDAPAIREAAGAQIGPYKLRQQIGEGGMGVVFMAEQTQPVERRVALKIIKPGMDTRQVIARFEAERQALALMDHPNIAKVLDAAATDSGRPYFVMELVKGIPVTKYCDEQQLTPKQRLELFIPVCQAVQHAHQKGIIHRDLKPSNVLVARYDGQPVPKVIDFGVAKATSQKLTEKTMFTELGQVIGTLEYMSPEQAEVNQLDIDTRSDIYSLGVLLYELLTGVTPFDRQRLRSAAFDEMLRIIREEEPPRPSMRLSTIETLPSVAANRRVEPSKLRTLVRGELDWIVMKSLEKDRMRRYETANNFVADIRRYLDDEPVEACPPSARYRFQKFARRNKAALATATVIALALLLGLIGTTWQWRRAEIALDSAESAQAAAEEQRDRANKERNRADNEALRANENARHEKVGRLAAESRLMPDDRPITSLLLAIEAVDLSRANDKPLLPIAHEALLNATQRIGGQPLIGLAGKVSDMAMNSDWLVTIADNTAQLWDLTSGTPASLPRTLGEDGETINSMALSDDGRWLFTGGSQLQRWDLVARNPDSSPLVLESGEFDITIGALSSDSRWLVSQSADGAARLWDLTATGPPASRVFARTKHFDEVVISPDGRWTATRYAEIVQLWDLHDENPSPLLLKSGPQFTNKNIKSMQVSPDSRTLVTTYQNSGLMYFWDLTAKDPAAAPRVLGNPDLNETGSARVYFTPDNRWMFRSKDTTGHIHRWDMSVPDVESSHERWRGHPSLCNIQAFSPDGRWLVSGSYDRTARLWDLASEDPVSTAVAFGSHDDPVHLSAIHPQGRWIATASRSYETVRLWKIEPANPRPSSFVLQIQPGREDVDFSRTAISSTGRWIATTINDHDVQLWDLKAKEPSLFSRVLRGHKDKVTSLEIGPDDRWLVSGSRDNTARLWDLTARDIQSSSKVLGNPNIADPQRIEARNGTGAVGVDATGRWLAMAIADHKVQLWDLGADDPADSTLVLTGHDSRVQSIAISPDGRWLVTGARRAARLWDLQAADIQASSRLLPRASFSVFQLAIDGNSRWLAVMNSPDTMLYDLKAQDPTALPRVFHGPEGKWIWRVALSPDGRWLFTQYGGSTARLWDLNAKDSPMYELREEFGAQSVAISPDSRRMVTATRFKTAQLWDLTAPDPTSTARHLRGHDGVIYKAKFSSDGRWLVTDGYDGTVRRWNLDVEWLLDYARNVAGRKLTDEEREFYRLNASEETSTSAVPPYQIETKLRHSTFFNKAQTLNVFRQFLARPDG